MTRPVRHLSAARAKGAENAMFWLSDRDPVLVSSGLFVANPFTPEQRFVLNRFTPW